MSWEGPNLAWAGHAPGQGLRDPRDPVRPLTAATFNNFPIPDYTAAFTGWFKCDYR